MQWQGKTVAVVVGDLGGAKEVVPIAKELERRGATVRYFLDSSPKAKAGDVLMKAGVSYETRDPNAEDKFDVILAGTSATANGAQVKWTEWGWANRIKVVWMEDLHGTGSRANSRSVTPDFMLVIDEMAARIAEKVRPGLRTIVVGKPTFSDPKELPRLEDGPAIRAKIRAEFELDDNRFLIVAGFGGDPAERSETQLQMILDKLSKLFPQDLFRWAPDCMNLDVVEYFLHTCTVIAWRFHPKHPSANELWEKAESACAAEGIRTVDARKVDMNHLTIAADLCIADWGNTNQLAAVLHGTPVATMMFPEDSRLVDIYPPDGVPPVVATDSGWGVIFIEQLARLIAQTYSAGPGLQMRDYTRNVRGKTFASLLQPGVAERAANLIELIINPSPKKTKINVSELMDRLENDPIVS